MIARSLSRFQSDDPFRLLEAEVSGRSAYLAKLKDASDAELAAGPPVSPIGARDRRPLTRESVDFAMEFLDEAKKIYASGNRKDARERMIELVHWAKSSGKADALADIDRFVQAFDASERMRGLFDRRLTKIRKVMSGGETRNAAGLYRIAIAEFAPRRVSFWGAVERTQRGQEAQPAVQSDALNQALEDVRGLLALLAEASEIEECDFSTAGVSTAIDFLPVYATGLHELVRVLEIRAQAHFDAEEPAEAITDLLTVCRVAGHLTDDSNMLSALVAHDAVRRVVRKLSERLGEHASDFLVGNDLAKIFERFQPDDPFGYHRSAARTREALPARLTGCTSQDFQPWSQDDLYALVMYIAVLAHGETTLTQPWVVRLETIETLIGAHALDSLRATWEKLPVDSFRHWARLRSFTESPFEAPGKPMFGFCDAMTSVGDDWRSLLDLVRTPTPPDR